MNNNIAHQLGARQKGDGVQFAVWAPNATGVSVIGDFNGWNDGSHRMHKDEHSGIWNATVAGAHHGQRYKYRVSSAEGPFVDKSDPVGFYFERSPQTASIIWDLAFDWSDQDFVRSRASHQGSQRPVSIYEMHIGSWRKGLSYRELASVLPAYLKGLGFTHVEFQPVSEHPFYGSWGYQTTGYFAPTSRYGTPQDFMALVNALHAANIGVILDWSCAHFPDDPHGLALFDGTHLYEHAHPHQRIHPDWGSLIFNYGRDEVRDFLISSALFWIERYHIDGIRVDAVASMLYLDYSRKPGEWIPNVHGGHENLEAVAFLKELNSQIKKEHPGVLCIAEESTTWPKLTTPVEDGGLGFDMKWDMGWMHDTLEYFGKDPVHRKHHQGQLVFRSNYAFSEKFVLALSHDEVVHKKRSLLAKMPGEYAHGFANLRCLLAYQYALPGKKLLFMGTELAPHDEWDHEASLNFGHLSEAAHAGVNKLVGDLNRLYQTLPFLHETDGEEHGFMWLDHSDHVNSVMSFARRAKDSSDTLICVFNFTPVARHNYRVAALAPGRYAEVLNTDSHFYGGSGFGNLGSVDAHPIEHQGWPDSLCLVLPPLSAIFLRLYE